jgi:hypothetical protein
MDARGKAEQIDDARMRRGRGGGARKARDVAINVLEDRGRLGVRGSDDIRAIAGEVGLVVT